MKRKNLFILSAAILFSHLLSPGPSLADDISPDIARAAGQTVGVFQLSPAGGRNGYNDMTIATPAFEGQVAVSYYGNKAPFIWVARSTNRGDWMGPMNIMSTVCFGSPTQMSTNDTGHYDFYTFGNTNLNVTNGVAMQDNGPLILHTMSGFGQTSITFSFVTNNGTQAIESDVNAANIGIGGGSYPIEAARGFFYMNTDPGFSLGFTGPTARPEPNSFYSFKQILAVDNIGKRLIHFLLDVPQVGSFTNVNSKDIMLLDRISGTVQITNGATTLKELRVTGSLATSIIAQTSNYKISAAISTILMNGTMLTATLPDAASDARGRIYTIKNINSSPLTVTTTHSQTIDGTPSVTLAQNKAVTVQSDGSNWQITGGY